MCIKSNLISLSPGNVQPLLGMSHEFSPLMIHASPAFRVVVASPSQARRVAKAFTTRLRNREAILIPES